MSAKKVHEIDSRPVRVALVYRKGCTMIDQTKPTASLYTFWRCALPQCADIDFSRVPVRTNEFDLKTLVGKADVVVMAPFKNKRGPLVWHNADNVDIPVVYIVGDAQTAKLDTKHVNKVSGKPFIIEELVKMYGVDLCIQTHGTNHVRVCGWEDLQSVFLMCGVVSSWYSDNPGWNERDVNIVLSGRLSRGTHLKGKRAQHGPHYALRCDCKGLRGVVCMGRSNSTCGKNYAHALHKYRAGIAACTTTPVQKYLEIPAAGCLTFCEVTEQNGAEETGLIDGVHCVHITPDNYRDKMEEYLDTADDDRWSDMARRGRDFVLRNHTTDVAASKFALIAKELVRAGRGNRMDEERVRSILRTK